MLAGACLPHIYTKSSTFFYFITQRKKGEHFFRLQDISSYAFNQKQVCPLLCLRMITSKLIPFSLGSDLLSTEDLPAIQILVEVSS